MECATRVVVTGATTIHPPGVKDCHPGDRRTGHRTDHSLHVRLLWFSILVAGIVADESALNPAHVRIAGVRNISGYAIVLTFGEPLPGPTMVWPGDVTTELNALLSGAWTIALNPARPAALRGRSGRATDSVDPWPAFVLRPLLECAVSDQLLALHSSRIFCR